MFSDQTAVSSSSTRKMPTATSWGSIWAGAVIALGVVTLFLVAGLGGSAGSVNVQTEGWWRAPLALAGASGAVALLTALFVGGFAAAWGAGARARLDGALHGATVWGVVAIAIAWLVASTAAATVEGVSNVVSGTARAATHALGAGADGLGAAMGGAAKKAAGQLDGEFDVDAMLKPVNEALVQNGRKPLDSKQLENVVRTLARTAVRQGKLDKAMAIETLVKESNISQADAEMAAAQLQKQYDGMKAQAGQATDDLRSKAREVSGELQAQVEGHADEVASALSRASWGLFVALALSLASALAGGLAGAGLRGRAPVAA